MTAVLAEAWWLMHRELLLFAAVLLVLFSVDELLIDAVYLWLRLSRRIVPQVPPDAPLRGRVAVFIPAWQEARVIGTTIGHALAVWPQPDVTVYVGCYANDPATAAAVRRSMASARGRLRLVVHEVPGPTCKADCLNRLHAALCEDEREGGYLYRMVVLHDAEDMVDPDALALLDAAIETADFVQLPVLALPQKRSRWVAGHYSDEFAEAHGKAMVVRSALGAALPGAGVGSAIARPMLARLAGAGSTNGSWGQPFGAGSLVEDYELGFAVARLGGRSRFLRVRDGAGRLVATRAYFPARLGAAVRQKTRWTHGIALQGWDRIGWQGRWRDTYMLLRDRRGPLDALLLAVAYGLVLTAIPSVTLPVSDLAHPAPMPDWLKALLGVNLVCLLWRAGCRFAFTAREFGWREGLRGVLRIPVSNVIAIMAGQRAFLAYCRSLRGRAPVWDKTDHDAHPAAEMPRLAA